MDDNCLMLDETLMLSPLPPYLQVLASPAPTSAIPAAAAAGAPGAALGAKLGRPDKDVVAVTGDGFYMYSVANAAIAAAVRYRAPFMSVIYQNRSYSTGTRADRAVLSRRLCGAAAASKPATSIRRSTSPRKPKRPAPMARTSRTRREVGPALQRGLAADPQRHAGGDRGLAAEDHARRLRPGT